MIDNYDVWIIPGRQGVYIYDAGLMPVIAASPGSVRHSFEEFDTAQKFALETAETLGYVCHDLTDYIRPEDCDFYAGRVGLWDSLDLDDWE